MGSIKKPAIAIIGTGYVGLVSGACFAELGYSVICVDKDLQKIARLKKADIPIYEPDLEHLVRKNVASSQLQFTTSLNEAFEKADMIFIAVGTPQQTEDSAPDLSFLQSVAKELAPLLTVPKILVIKSTVPIGTNRKIAELIRTLNHQAKFEMVSNPEFLREGVAVFDFMSPDRVVIGVESVATQKCMEAFYAPFTEKGIPLVVTDLETAEMIKYAANCFLAMRLAYVNELADLCEKVGGNIEKVMEGVGLDKRIGLQYLQTGPGFGGSCFPKDTEAFLHMAKNSDTSLSILEAVIASNKNRKQKLSDYIKQALGTLQSKTIAVLGLAFKANTDDIRDSAALSLIQELLKQDALVRVYDPVVKASTLSLFKSVTWPDSVYQAIEGADIVVIVTEWPEFRELDLALIKSLLKPEKSPPTLIDFRNLFDPETVARAGLRYISLGRKMLTPIAIN